MAARAQTPGADPEKAVPVVQEPFPVNNQDPAQPAAVAVPFPGTFVSLDAFQAAAVLNLRNITWGDEQKGEEDGPPKTVEAQVKEVQKLFAAAFDFSTFTQRAVQRSRSVQSYCENEALSALQKVNKILGSERRDNVHRIELAMWRLLVSFH